MELTDLPCSGLVKEAAKLLPAADDIKGDLVETSAGLDWTTAEA
jgi:hypothetical protein